MNAVEVKGLVKQYRNGVRALDGLDLTVRQGEIFALLGPNGAGKSTLLGILTACLRPTAGTAQVLGRDVARQPDAVRAVIASAAQRPGLDTCLSLEENLRFQGRLYGLPLREIEERAGRLLDGFGLRPYRGRPVASYSGGVKRRLDLAMSLLPGPQVLFLDEPTVGMDLPSRRAMQRMVRQTRDEWGTTVVFTTHDLAEAEALSDTVCFLRAGRAAAQGAPALLQQTAGGAGTLEELFLKLTAQEG